MILTQLASFKCKYVAIRIIFSLHKEFKQVLGNVIAAIAAGEMERGEGGFKLQQKEHG